jgi:hypothetical protein
MDSMGSSGTPTVQPQVPPRYGPRRPGAGEVPRSDRYVRPTSIDSVDQVPHASIGQEAITPEVDASSTSGKIARHRDNWALDNRLWQAENGRTDFRAWR